MSRSSASGNKPVLVTGGAGFIGCNVVDRLVSDGHRVVILDALARPGVERNLDWLMTKHGSRLTLMKEDIRDADAVAAATRDIAAVFHFAAQVAVTTSLAEPFEDFSVNLQGTINLLEALRRRGEGTPLIFASTNKVYGDLSDIELSVVENAYQPSDEILRARGISEERGLDFHTPYGCSKGAADQYVLDYARSFGVPTCVMRMSCVYGPHQMGNEDQGWVAHFVLRALAGEQISIFGDGMQVRDILFVDDAVEAYVQAWRRIDQVQGRAFNLGGGPANAVSLRQLLLHLDTVLGRKADIAFHPWRAGDQRYYVSDTRLVARELGFSPAVAWRGGVVQLANWLRQHVGQDLSNQPPAQQVVGA